MRAAPALPGQRSPIDDPRPGDLLRQGRTLLRVTAADGVWVQWREERPHLAPGVVPTMARSAPIHIWRTGARGAHVLEVA